MSQISNKKSLLKLENLVEASIVKRPSKIIKSPYVADIIIDNSEIQYLAHTASLGCCGLSDSNSVVLVQPIIPSNKNKDSKCKYRVCLSIVKNGNNETIVGIYPKLAEQLAQKALTGNFLSSLQNVKSYSRETYIYVKDQIDSRFDFSGMDKDGVPFLMEVKNVPLADFEDMTAVERKKHDFSGREFNSKVAYFPDGYRKKSTDPVSPRALKHVNELAAIKKKFVMTNRNVRCILCFVIQRTDVNRFTTSIIDLEYKKAVKEATEIGVEIITMVVEWTREGNAYFIRDDLPALL